MFWKFVILWLTLGLAMMLLGLIVTTMFAIVGWLMKKFKKK